MTISSTTRIAGPFLSGTALPFTFKVFSSADLSVVRLDTSTGAETSLVLSSDYTVALNGNQNTNPGGTVNLTVAASATSTVTITSDIANLQPTDLTNQGGFYPEVITDSLDRATIQIQQISDIGDRAIRIPLSDGTGFDMTLPTAVERQNKYLVFDANGQPIVSSGSGTDTALRTDLAVDTFASAGAGLVGFRQSGTGASARTVLTKLRDVVSVKDFGAVGDGTTNDTAAIQAAITSGYSLVFPAGTYLCNNLTQSTSFQRFYASGSVNLSKNANGVLLSSTGGYVEFHGIQFIGTGFTGNNVEATGTAFALINCSSYGTPGRAVKCTGNLVRIIGTCGSYTTTDTSGTGYEIEIGVSGTATLYHELRGVYSSTATGGIKLVDTGSQWIVGGQFGKLYIAAGTSPAGVNGGMISNCRIVGDVTVELSNSVFSGNQFSTQTITFAAGTSQHTLDQSNNAVSATIVNNGNANSVITRATSAGSTLDLSFGASSWANTVKLDNVGTWEFSGNLVLPNAKGIQIKDSGGTSRSAVVLNASDDYTFGSNNGANFTNLSAGSAGVFAAVGGSSVTQTSATAFQPTTDNAVSCGGPSPNRWSVVYAATGTINTSDARSKEQVRSINSAEIAVAMQLKGMISAFKFTDAVALKGSGARIHFGVIAQDVRDAFVANGLDPNAYGMFCHDSWEAREAVVSDDGTVICPAQTAGDRYGIRYDELLAFIIAAM